MTCRHTRQSYMLQDRRQRGASRRIDCAGKGQRGRTGACEGGPGHSVRRGIRSGDGSWVSVIFVAVAALASYMPAQRGSYVDLMVAPSRIATRCSVWARTNTITASSIHAAVTVADLLDLAERVGFEPTVGFPLHTLSKRAPSTTRTSLRVFRINRLQASG